MKINSIIWENVKVKFPTLPKIKERPNVRGRANEYDWNDCMIIFRDGFMTINRMEHGVTSEDSLGVGAIRITELTPWNMKANVSGTWDNILYEGTLEAEF